MNRTAGEMIEYLKEFDTESKCKVLVADPERRKRYDVEAAVVIDADAPILCLKVCKEHDMDMELIKTAMQCEKPNVTYADEMRIVYSCANCKEQYITDRKKYEDGHLNYCQRCGQRFNWEGVELDET